MFIFKRKAKEKSVALNSRLKAAVSCNQAEDGSNALICADDYLAKLEAVKNK